MSLNDTMVGFKKLKNEKAYTTQSLWEQIKDTPFSVGNPIIGEIAKKPAIRFQEHNNMVVYIYVKEKSIEIAKTVEKGLGVHILKELGAAALTDVEGDATAAEDRAVDEVYEVIKGLLTNGTAENKNAATAASVLYMRQKILSIRDKFSICTEDETPVLWVAGSLTGLNFKMVDINETPILEIKKKLIAIMPEYSIVKAGKTIGTLKKLKLTRAEIKGSVEGKELQILGDFQGYHYNIKLDGIVIGNVDAQRLTWGDVYAIEIMDESLKDLIIAIAVIVDNIIAAQEK